MSAGCSLPSSDLINNLYVILNVAKIVCFLFTKGMVRGSENNTFLYSQNKCVRYWPVDGESMESGNFTITNANENTSNDYTLRELVITRTSEVDIPL